MTDLSMYKLGARFHEDKRTIKLSTVLKKLPSYPASYDVDSVYPNLTDNNMYGNDTLGDCVIAGRAHCTLRWEDYQQKIVIPITDQDVTTEYFKETGGSDSGLDMINSLNAWRQGWTAAGNNYSIYAYASVDPSNQAEVSAAMYLLNGLYIGLRLPISAQTQDVWDVASGPNGVPGSWGGHCVYLVAYDANGLTCITWGKRQRMTWAFLATYSDQAFALVDNKDSWVVNDIIDVAALDAILAQITSNPSPTPTSGTMTFQVTPSNATIAIDGGVIPGHPSSILINPGGYSVTASLSGYKSQKQTVTVVSNQTTNVTFNLKKSGLCIFN